ncbi:major facilitator superfamily MFS_1 [Hypoxylon sp. FL0543]|nr:major facilitator superfamily MFS_1 [Hypoxylon sp. FL0543]
MSASKSLKPSKLAGEEEFKASWRLRAITIVIMVLSLTSGLDSIIINTPLLTITRDIGGARQYVWTISLPSYGQMASIHGRRNPLFVVIILFALGSGIGGGATNVAMLIVGRAAQKLGTGGIAVLLEIIIYDLVSPRSRGSWLSINMSGAAVGTTLGPIIGGTLAERNWRWIFCLNLPTSAVQYTRSPTGKSALALVDFSGTAIFVPSMVSLYLDLVMSGTAGYPWSSWSMMMPIVMGIAGWIAFHFHQASRLSREPSVPPRLFNSRTSVTSLLLIFLASITVNSFLPVYFQGVEGTSGLQSGVNYLPFALAIIPFGNMAGVIQPKTGRYKVLHLAGFSLRAIDLGLFSTFRADSSVGAWAGYQVLVSGGSGFIFTATVPSTLAALPEPYVATVTGMYAFVRSLGFVWGVTMSSIVFNGQVNDNMDIVHDVDLRRLLADGAAYAFTAGCGYADSALREPRRSQVVEVCWLVVIDAGGLQRSSYLRASRGI